MKSSSGIRYFPNPAVSALLILLLGAAAPSPAEAYDVPLAWDAPTVNADGSELSDLSYYRLKYGTAPGGPFPTTLTSSSPAKTISGLSAGTYFAVVTAVDSNGNESLASNELAFTVGEADSDGDGLSDSYETSIGTDPNNPDSDGDSVSDGKETADGTNPLDAGSHYPVHESRVCAPWNGFLVDALGRPMWNVFEHVNAGSKTLNIATSIYDIAGSLADSFGFYIFAGRQRDVLIHDSPGRELNSYGTVCSDSDGFPGDLRGTMVYYKQSLDPFSFDFALAVHARPARAGTQYLFNNTYQPSLSPEDAANVVAIWGQLSSASTTAESGELLFWAQDGSLISKDRVTLEAKARFDVGLHQIGPNKVGIVEWRPDNPAARFTFDASRYLYDNPSLINSFESAFLLPALVGTGEPLAVPYDTAGATSVLEVANTLQTAITAVVSIYSVQGALIDSLTVPLAGKASRHIILNELAPEGRGIAVIEGFTANSVIAVAMQYRRRADGSVHFLYGVSASPGYGVELIGAYNTYLEQDSELWLLNPGASNASAAVTMTRSSGELRMSGETFEIPARGLKIVRLNERESTDHYGVLRVLSPEKNTVLAWVFRRRLEEYVIPLQLTE